MLSDDHAAVRCFGMHLHALLCGVSGQNSRNAALCAAFIWRRFPTKRNAHPAERMLDALESLRGKGDERLIKREHFPHKLPERRADVGGGNCIISDSQKTKHNHTPGKENNTMKKMFTRRLFIYMLTALIITISTIFVLQTVRSEERR